MPFAFQIRRQPFTLRGVKFRISNREGELIGFGRKVPHQLWDEFRVYRDESRSAEWMWIRERQTCEVAWLYDVCESPTGTRIGVVQRKPTWLGEGTMTLFGRNEQMVGVIPSLHLTLIEHRSLESLFPKTYQLQDHAGREVGSIRSNWNPFIRILTVTLESDSPVEPLLALAAAIVILDNYE